jgi:homoserine kinase
VPAVTTGTRAVVRVPATSANLGPGFDALGLALSLYDDVGAAVVDGTGVVVEIEGNGADDLPRDERHLVVQAMTETFTVLGLDRPGLSLKCTNRIAHGRGLGSSAAAVVAGILLARELADGGGTAGFDDDDVLSLASRLEGHPDNAAAALLGGLTVAWSEPGGQVRAARLQPHPSLGAVVLVPDATLATEQARGMLPDQVPHADAAHAAGRAALLVHAVTTDPSLLLAATEDRLHQSYRERAMPASLDLVRRLRAAGHAAVVSGAGPSVLVLTGERTGSDPVSDTEVSDTEASDTEKLAGAGWTVRRVDIELEGARLVTQG